MCWRSKCSATGSNVPGGKSNCQRGAGAFLEGLMQGWGYGHVRDLIFDRFEVLDCLPWMEGASCSYWSTRLGGSNRLSQQVVQDSNYSNMHSNFKRKSTIYEGKTISNSITWRSSSWSSIWGRVRNLWSETELVLPIGGLVFRKTWMYPKISSDENAFVSKLFKMVRCWRRSVSSWRLSWAKFYMLFCGGFWK